MTHKGNNTARKSIQSAIFYETYQIYFLCEIEHRISKYIFHLGLRNLSPTDLRN